MKLFSYTLRDCHVLIGKKWFNDIVWKSVSAKERRKFSLVYTFRKSAGLGRRKNPAAVWLQFHAVKCWMMNMMKISVIELSAWSGDWKTRSFLCGRWNSCQKARLTRRLAAGEKMEHPNYPSPEGSPGFQTVPPSKLIKNVPIHDLTSNWDKSYPKNNPYPKLKSRNCFRQLR